MTSVVSMMEFVKFTVYNLILCFHMCLLLFLFVLLELQHCGKPSTCIAAQFLC